MLNKDYSGISQNLSGSDAFEKRNIIEIDAMKIPFISLKDLVTNKLSTGRPKDKLDAEKLTELDPAN